MEGLAPFPYNAIPSRDFGIDNENDDSNHTKRGAAVAAVDGLGKMRSIQ